MSARVARRFAAALLAAAPLVPTTPSQPIPSWYEEMDCYTPAPSIGAAQRATGNFDAYSASGMSAADQDCLRLNQMLRDLRRGDRWR
jgi:hypothetical protein